MVRSLIHMHYIAHCARHGYRRQHGRERRAHWWTQTLWFLGNVEHSLRR